MRNSSNPRLNPLYALALMRRQQGVAVLTVLLVVAMGAALAYALANQQIMVIAQSRQVLVGDALRDMLLGGEVLARQMLREDYIEDQEDTPLVDTLNEPWAQAVPPFEVPGGFIEIQAKDLHSCFNLNSVPTVVAQGTTNPGARKLLRDLFEDIELGRDFADRWIDWIDEGEDVNDFGAEDNEYLSQEVGYRTPNTLASHLSEVRLLDEIEHEQWQALNKIACINRWPTKMNVHTITPDIISFLSREDWRDAEDDEISEAGSFPEYTGVDDFMLANTSLDSNMDPTLFTLTSDYFEISIRAELDGEKAAMVSTLYRDPNDGKITVLGRDFSRRFISRFEDPEQDTEEDSGF